MPRQFLPQDLARTVKVALDGTARQPSHLLDLGQIEILQVMQADDQPLRCTQPFQRLAKMATSLQRLAQFSRPRPFIADPQFSGTSTATIHCASSRRRRRCCNAVV